MVRVRGLRPTAAFLDGSWGHRRNRVFCQKWDKAETLALVETGLKEAAGDAGDRLDEI